MTTETGHTAAIRAGKVLGTDVKNASGENIGEIEEIVLDKLSNNIMFAVVGFGGFLGVGEKYHPLPWGMLNYSEDDDAYVVDITKSQLESAPADSIDALVRNDGKDYRDQVYTYYNYPRYW